MAAIASLEFSACDSAVWVQCKVSNRFCFHRQILKRRLPDKNFCQRSMCPSVCFHFPHAWAKNGGTCKPTADISSQRHVAHFRDFGFHSRIICDYLKVSDGGFSQEVISKLPAAWFMEEPRMDRAMKSGNMIKRASLSFIWLTCMLFLNSFWQVNNNATMRIKQPAFLSCFYPTCELGVSVFFLWFVFLQFSSVFLGICTLQTFNSWH